MARTYADAIEAFADEHGGRAPVPGSDDWPARPAGTTASLPDFAAGPRNAADGDRPYLAKIPEPISVGSLQLRTSAAPTQDSPVRGATRITYVVGVGTEWQLGVDVARPAADGAAWRASCSLGPARRSAEATC